MGGRYASLQKIGELQRQVYAHQISVHEAKQEVTEEDYDQAFGAVQAIFKGAVHDAFRLSNPEVRIVENLPTIGALSLTSQNDEIHTIVEQNYQGGKFSANEDISDIFKPRFRVATSISEIFKPRVNLSTSLGNGRINFEPSFQLGRLYSISFDTKNEEYEHELRYRLDNLSFRVELKHTPDTFKNINSVIMYSIDALSMVNVNYAYDFIERDHTISIGFSKQF